MIDVYFIPLILLLGYIVVDTYFTRKYRNQVKYVIHVNGIRGKSSIVRMLDAMFREHGYQTFSKVTGTVPKYRGVDGVEHEVKRHTVTMREQRRFLKRAARENADVLIIECMALRPEMQKLSELILKADLAIVANIKTDHLEVMGIDHESIGVTLMEMTHRDQKIITADPKLYDQFVQTRPNLLLAGDFPAVKDEHKENTNIAFEVATEFEMDFVKVKNAIMNYQRDVGHQSSMDFKGNELLFGFAINDLESTIELYDKYEAKEREIIWFNDRYDRPERSTMFLRWMSKISPDTILLSGDNVQMNKVFLKNSGYKGEVFSVSEFYDSNQRILGIGNIKGIEKVLGDDYYV